MPKLKVETDSSDVQMGFPIPKPGKVPCLLDTPTVEDSKKGKPMIVVGLKPTSDIACTITDPETNEQKEVMTGAGRAILKFYASLSAGALKNGSVRKLEIACGLPKGTIHNGAEVDTDILPSLAGKTVIADVKNTTSDDGRLQANVNDLFRM